MAMSDQSYVPAVSLPRKAIQMIVGWNLTAGVNMAVKREIPKNSPTFCKI
jgi:hypothetical protein